MRTQTATYEAVVRITVEVPENKTRPDPNEVATAAENAVGLSLSTEDSQHLIGESEIVAVEIDWEKTLAISVAAPKRK